MRKTYYLCLFICLFCASVAHAENNPGKKLVRGVTNIVTAPFEIPKHARAYWIEGAYKTDHILVWVGCGAVWGMVQGIKRTGSGIWDIISFPFDKPEEYQPLLKPEYVFQDWPSDPDVFIFKRKQND